MNRAARNASDYESLRVTRRMLAGMAPVVRLALWGAGIALFLNHVGPLFSDAQWTWGERVVAGIVAVIDLGACGLAGWVMGWLFRGTAELIDVMVDQAEATDRTANLLEWHVAPALDRMAVALERSLAEPKPSADGQALAIAGIRQTIADGQWDQAERLVAAFARDAPDVAEAQLLSMELAEARRAAIADLHARLDAAKAAHDPIRAIEYRDALTQHLRGEPLHDLDHQLIRWVMGMIQRRLRAGKVQRDVAELAARAADSFGDTPEGASLRASLPTLRRSAGLCPRCAQPFVGIEDACPQCLAGAATRAATPPLPAGPSPEVSS
jgi:hypothetical protein